MKRLAEVSPRSQARIAGLLYLFIAAGGGGFLTPFSIAPSGMMLGDAALPTPEKILASMPSYVLGGFVLLLVYACDIGVALIFYELLKPVSRSVALLAASLRLAFVGIACANLLNHFAPLILLKGSGDPGAFGPEQSRALALVFLRLRTIGFDVALVFFGLHFIAVGYLFFRSTFYPRILGIALAIGGVSYLFNILVLAIPPAIGAYLFPYVMLPAGAEIVLILWLIIVGVNVPRWRELAGAAN
jgi:hypothetical protein